MLRGHALAGAPTALASLLVSPQPHSMLPLHVGGSRGDAIPALCVTPKDLGSLPTACCHPGVTLASQGSLELQAASNQGEHSSLLPAPGSSRGHAAVDIPWRCPCSRALCPSWLCQPSGPTHCLSPLQPWHGPSLPSSASFRRSESPQPMFGNFLSCSGPPGAKQGAPGASGGEGRGQKGTYCSPSSQRNLASAALALQTPPSSSSSGTCLK